MGDVQGSVPPGNVSFKWDSLRGTAGITAPADLTVCRCFFICAKNLSVFVRKERPNSPQISSCCWQVSWVRCLLMPANINSVFWACGFPISRIAVWKAGRTPWNRSALFFLDDSVPPVGSDARHLFPSRYPCCEVDLPCAAATTADIRSSSWLKTCAPAWASLFPRTTMWPRPPASPSCGLIAKACPKPLWCDGAWFPIGRRTRSRHIRWSTLKRKRWPQGRLTFASEISHLIWKDTAAGMCPSARPGVLGTA